MNVLLKQGKTNGLPSVFDKGLRLSLARLLVAETVVWHLWLLNEVVESPFRRNDRRELRISCPTSPVILRFLALALATTVSRERYAATSDSLSSGRRYL